MSHKFEAFHKALVELLNEYDYMLSTTMYDGIVVSDRKENAPPIWCDFSDDTSSKPEETP